MSLTPMSTNTENTSRIEAAETPFPDAIQTRIDSSEARVIKAVFPQSPTITIRYLVAKL